MTADYVQRSSQLNQVAFIRRERHTVEVQITAGNSGIEQQELLYVLIGPKGEELSKGKLELSTALQPGAKGNGVIADGQIPSTVRIVIRKYIAWIGQP